jgi:membrane dipeptidase
MSSTPPATGTIPIFDGHNDVLLRLVRQQDGDAGAFLRRNDFGHLDWPRAVEGGFAGGMFATFVPSEKRRSRRTQGNGIEPVFPETPSLPDAQAVTLAMAATLFRIEALAEGGFKVVRRAEELRDCLARGVMAASWHIEGAEAIDAKLDALEVFYQGGLRSLGLVWSRPNIFGHGVPFRFPCSPDTGPGLTDLGRALVKACNQLGILIDLSHLNEQGFWDVARLSDAPLVATHSNAHALCPTARNLTDAQLRAIRESDGMVGLNFAVGFLRPDGTDRADTGLDVMVSHIDYLIEQLGEDRVGFGSDFDGATMPREIGDAAGLQHLVEALRAHGYNDALLRKLGHENWLRVLIRTWKS